VISSLLQMKRQLCHESKFPTPHALWNWLKRLYANFQVKRSQIDPVHEGFVMNFQHEQDCQHSNPVFYLGLVFYAKHNIIQPFWGLKRFVFTVKKICNQWGILVPLGHCVTNQNSPPLTLFEIDWKGCMQIFRSNGCELTQFTRVLRCIFNANEIANTPITFFPWDLLSMPNTVYPNYFES
jgi:hypothetical protein